MTSCYYFFQKFKYLFNKIFNAENIRDVTYILKAQISNLKPQNSVPAMFLLQLENHQ